MSNSLENLHKVVSNQELRTAGINTIALPGELQGKQKSWPYCGICPHCGAAQNNHFVGEKVRKSLYWGDGGQQTTRLVPFNRFLPGKGRWIFIPEDAR